MNEGGTPANQKNDYYYMVLSYLDANGKRKQPWFPTGLPIKNNKKRAEKILLELRQTYVPLPPPSTSQTESCPPHALSPEYMWGCGWFSPFH